MTEDLLVKTLLDARPRLIAGTLAVLRDAHQAEDVFQEVMIKALRMCGSFSDEARLLTWTQVLRKSPLSSARSFSKPSTPTPASESRTSRS